MLDSLLLCPVGSTAITTTIGGKVGAAFSAAASYFSTSRCFSPLGTAAAAAAGRCQAVWSCKSVCRAAQMAQQRSGYLRAAQAARPRASGGFGGAARLAYSQLAVCIVYVKKVRSVTAYFSGCVYVCVCPMRRSDAPNSPLHKGMCGVARM